MKKTRNLLSVILTLAMLVSLAVIPQTVSASGYTEQLIYSEDFSSFTEGTDYVKAAYDSSSYTNGTWYIGTGGRVVSHNLAYGAFAKGNSERTHVPYMFPDSFDNTKNKYEVSFKYKNHSGTSRIYLLSSEGDMINLDITSWGTTPTYYGVKLEFDSTSCKVYRSEKELKNISISGKKIVGMILFLYASSSSETTSYAWIDDVIVKQGDTVIASENFDDWQRADINAQTEAEIAYKGAEKVLQATTPSLYARPDGEDKCLATQWHTKGAGTGERITFVFPEVMTSGKYKITYDYLAAGNWCDYLYLYTSSGSSQINFPWDSNQQSVWREMVVNVDVDAGIWTAANRSGSASIDGTVDRMVLRMHQNAENGVEMLIDNVKIYKLIPYYDITITAPSNGAVVPSAATAEEDDTVTLTVTPDGGYELDTLTVTDADSSPVSYTADNNGGYTFTMPASDVSVSAAFKAVQNQITWTASADYGKITEEDKTNTLRFKARPTTPSGYEFATSNYGFVFINFDTFGDMSGAEAYTSGYDLPANAANRIKSVNVADGNSLRSGGTFYYDITGISPSVQYTVNMYAVPYVLRDSKIIAWGSPFTYTKNGGRLN